MRVQVNGSSISATPRSVWIKLAGDELLESKGHAGRLTGRVQECYALSRETADKAGQELSPAIHGVDYCNRPGICWRGAVEEPGILSEHFRAERLKNTRSQSTVVTP